MKLVLFTHPSFVKSQSMPRFARMLEEAYLLRGHEVRVWSPQPFFCRLWQKGRVAKWLRYMDKYIIFPLWVRGKLNKQPEDILYVFCDQALGFWVPLVKNKPHIVHVHDLLALRSSLGYEPFNPTSWTGRIYQHFIRQGFKQAKHFISISNKTRDDLHFFGQVSKDSSHMVYNGFNYPYAPMAQSDAMRSLNDANLPAQSDGMLLHVGGNVWYKNLAGVIRIYIEYTKSEKNPLPLWCISPNPSPQIQVLLNQLPKNGEVLFFQDIDNKTLQAAYSLARVLLFPSLDEGFGWPIIEAQACGCLVLTTDAAPMNEVGGAHSIYLPPLKYNDDQELWAKKCCEILTKLLNLDSLELSELSLRGMNWVKRFNADSAIEDYLNIYKSVLEKY